MCLGASMLHWAQQLWIDPYESRRRHSVEPIILAPTLPDQSHVARACHDRLMAEFSQQPAYPW
jgi:hypothetical protein